MTEPVKKVLGEGGVHLHKLATPIKTQEDGFHKHLFFVNDRLVMTDLSGMHAHDVDAKGSKVGPELKQHMHQVPINTQDGMIAFDTESGTSHTHELQSQTTTLSGLHTHILKLGSESYISLLPGDLIDAVENAVKEDQSLKNFKIKKSNPNPLEMNFELVKRLNADDFKTVMKNAATVAIIKSMLRLSDGLQIERIILSRSRFFDIGVATKFILDSGLGINGAAETETEYVFNIRAKEKFDESSLQRIRLSDGVEAVVGLLAEEKATEEDTVEAELPTLTDRNKEGETVAIATKQIPAEGASNEEKRKLQKERARKFGIESLVDGNESLIPPAGTSSDLAKWGDPVNFKFPLDSDGRIRNAVARYGQGIGDYSKESSKKRVAERIAKASKTANIVISSDTEIWNYLSQKTRELFKVEAPSGSLKARFAGFMSSIMDEPEDLKKNVEETPKKKNQLINWKTESVITGTGAAKIEEIAKTLTIERKYVTVESAQKRFVEFLISKYEVKNAVYTDSASSDENQTEKFLSFEIRGEGIDAILFSEELSTNSWRKSLIIFFDDAEKLDEIFKTEIKNHEFGAYEYKQTMMGPVLYPVEIDKELVPILDEDLLKALESDTHLFFSKQVENFFNGENPIKKKMPYKRGVLMYGPPGNGKTTFIKHFVTSFDCAYSILCESQNFDPHMGKFLADTLGHDAKKVLVFEDVDSIDYHHRSSFLNFLDGAVGIHKTLIIATTNYPGRLDDALMKRPSRFDQKYKIDLPNEKMRSKFLLHFFPDLPPADLQKHVQSTAGFSGAYFKELFILKGMRQCAVEKAIELILLQMVDVRKSETSVEDIEWVLNDELDISQFSDARMIRKGMEELAKIDDEDEEETEEDDDVEEVDFSENDEDTEEEVEEDVETVKVSLFFDICKEVTEQRLVIGPVLVPENFDLQDDIISADEIQKAAHNYLIKLNFSDDPEFLKSLGLNEKSKRGFMHTEFNRKIALVESYLAPVDFTLNKREIKAGTWVMAVKVFDDEVWNLVKAKRITGFSIGGRSRSIPAEE